MKIVVGKTKSLTSFSGTEAKEKPQATKFGSQVSFDSVIKGKSKQDILSILV